jgi:hypothetical protein
MSEGLAYLYRVSSYKVFNTVPQSVQKVLLSEPWHLKVRLQPGPTFRSVSVQGARWQKSLLSSLIGSTDIGFRV